MAIKIDDARVSVDFAYVDETTGEEFKIRLHNTDLYGRSFSISGNVGGFTDGNDQYLCLPAELLIEAVDYAREQQYIEQLPSGHPKKRGPTLGRSPYVASTRAAVSSDAQILPTTNFGDGEEEETVISPMISSKRPTKIDGDARPVQKLTASSEEQTTVLPTEQVVTTQEEYDEEDEPESLPQYDEDEDEGVDMIDPGEEDELARQMKKMKADHAKAQTNAKPPKKKVKKRKHEDLKKRIQRQLEESDNDIPEVEE